jgi:GAF domain-containing protein
VPYVLQCSGLHNQAEGAMQDSCKVLIADPDRTEVLQLATTFRQRGWHSLSAGDAILVQSIARKEIPSAIVLSSQLPGGGAMTAIQRLRATVHTIVTPVFVISKPGTAKKEDLLAAGANEFFEKPLDHNAVCRSIQKHLDRNVPLVLAPSEKIADPGRIAALDASGVLNTDRNRWLDYMTRIAASILGVPTTILSIVDKDRQFFKSQTGLPEPWSSARETPLSHSFCQWVVSSNEELVIEDARRQPALQSNLAIRDLGVVSYAGSPIFSKDGHSLGSFCAIDSRPREWTSAELDILRKFARMAEAELAIEKLKGDIDSKPMIHARATLILNATQILRRDELAAKPFEREMMLEIIEQQSRALTGSRTKIESMDLIPRLAASV